MIYTFSYLIEPVKEAKSVSIILSSIDNYIYVAIGIRGIIMLFPGGTVSCQCATAAVASCIVSSFLTALLATLFFLVFILCNNRRRSPKSSSTNEEMKTEEVVYEQVDDKVPTRVETIENESYATIQQ